MRCERFEEQLQDALDDRRSPGLDRELTRHAAGCPQCRALLGAAERMASAFAPAEPRLRRGRRWSWTAAAPSAAVAASLLVLLTLAQRPDWRESSSTAVALPTPSESGSAATDGLGRRERRMGRGGDVIRLGGHWRSNGPASSERSEGGAVVLRGAEAPRRVSMAMTGGALQPVSVRGAGTEPLAEIVTVLGESWSSLRQVKMDEVSEVAEGFRPLTQSVGTVMEALRGTWRGARRERMERGPDTSRVAENGWFA